MPESSGGLDPCLTTEGCSRGTCHSGTGVLQASCDTCPGDGGLLSCIPYHGPTSCTHVVHPTSSLYSSRHAQQQSRGLSARRSPAGTHPQRTDGHRDLCSQAAAVHTRRLSTLTPAHPSMHSPGAAPRRSPHPQHPRHTAPTSSELPPQSSAPRRAGTLQPSGAHRCAHRCAHPHAPAPARPQGDAPGQDGRCRSLPALVRGVSGGGSRCGRVPS